MHTKEPSSNLRFVCDKHAPRIKNKYSKMDPERFIGGYVKVAFDVKDPLNKPNIEHMWVLVRKVERGKLVGSLDNDPVYLCKYQLGDKVVVSLDKIEDALDKKGKSI